MPSVQKTKIFQVPIKKLYQTIIDVESYPNFVTGVHGIKILEKNADTLKVEYKLNILKSFTYVIEMKLTPETSVTWQLLEGDIFKKNTGSWLLKAINADQTEATYTLDVDFKIFAPSMIVSKLVGSNLPQMLDAFEQRAREN